MYNIENNKINSHEAKVHKGTQFNNTINTSPLITQRSSYTNTLDDEPITMCN